MEPLSAEKLGSADAVPDAIGVGKKDSADAVSFAPAALGVLALALAVIVAAAAAGHESLKKVRAYAALQPKPALGR